MALIVAITLLAVFALFGTEFVKYMGNEVTETGVDLHQMRARNLAEAGIRAATAELQRAYQVDEVARVLGMKTMLFPTYGRQQGDGGLAPQEVEDAQATATVVIEDENAKINLNHAPPSVLALVLGIESAVSRQITQSLPPANEAGRWLIHPDDLLVRGLVTPEAYADVPRAWVTTSTVTDHEHPVAYINVNRVPPAVLAAIVGVHPETASELAAKEFSSVEELGAAVGDPSLFRMRPEALSTASRCFRIVGEGRFAAPSGLSATARAEAIVMFDQDGAYRVLEWRTENVVLPDLPDPSPAETDAAGPVEPLA